MNHLQNSHLLAAAVGVTVGVITAAGICLYHKILENQQHTTTTINLEAVNKKIAELQAEVEAIRSQENQRRKKKKSAVRRRVPNDSTYTGTDNDTDIDAYSTAGTDIGDDEFYDCSDIESLQGDNDVGISGAMSQLDLELLEIDQIANREFDIETYYKLQSLVEAHPTNVEVVWRFARTCYKYSAATDDVNTKKALYDEGIKVCEKVLDCPHGELYKWYAILVGMRGESLPLAEKIKNGYHYKQYVMMAIELQPNDPEPHYLLGRFNYEVASLSWIEKKIVATVFSGLPPATYETALSCFQQSEDLRTVPHAGNRLYLGKTYIALNNYEEGVMWLEKALEVPAETIEQKTVQAEVEQLLKKYSSYRV